MIWFHCHHFCKYLICFIKKNSIRIVIQSIIFRILILDTRCKTGDNYTQGHTFMAISQGMVTGCSQERIINNRGQFLRTDGRGISYVWIIRCIKDQRKIRNQSARRELEFRRAHREKINLAGLEHTALYMVRTDDIAERLLSIEHLYQRLDSRRKVKEVIVRMQIIPQPLRGESTNTCGN